MANDNQSYTDMDNQNKQRQGERGQNQGQENNPGNFSNRSREEIEEAGRKGGES